MSRSRLALSVLALTLIVGPQAGSVEVALQEQVEEAAAPSVAVADAQAGRSSSPWPASPLRQERAGLTQDGLRRSAGCPAWTLEDGTCTHGPDPAPPGLDTLEPLSTVQVRQRATTAASVSTSTTATVPCTGDGVTGPRVQALYVRAKDVPDRFTAVRASLASYAANVDDVFVQSAAKTGGLRHVRWLTTAPCTLDLRPVVVSPKGDDSLSAMISELKVQGYGRTDRKYLIWADATRYCGVAQTRYDDRATADNISNKGASYARVDAKCWGLTHSVEAHELTHMLGGVQPSAPNSNASGHCTDDSDRMCYSETGALPVRTVCEAAHERLLDCRNDDYFSTAPTAGSYLATHWNTANNVFLTGTPPTG